MTVCVLSSDNADTIRQLTSTVNDLNMKVWDNFFTQITVSFHSLSVWLLSLFLVINNFIVIIFLKVHTLITSEVLLLVPVGTGE